MSIEVISWVLRHSKAQGNARLVLIGLADAARPDGTGAFPSVKTLAEYGCMSPRAASDNLKRLRDDGRIRKTGKSMYDTVVYEVVMEEGGSADSAPRQIPAGSTQLSADNPSVNPSSSSEAPSELFPHADPVNEAFAAYLLTFKKPLRKPQPDERKLIRDALEVGTVEELRTCFAACQASDYHMKRGKYRTRPGGKYNSLGGILKPRPTKGETQRSRIEWWLEKRQEQTVKEAPDKPSKYTRRRS